MTMETGQKSKPRNSHGALPPGPLGSEATLAATAHELRNLNTAEYRLIAVGLTPLSRPADARKFFNDANGGAPVREERSPIHAH